MFECHTDVVTEGDASEWKYGPYEGKRAGSRIYGRGACDTKGNLAAAIKAVQAISQSAFLSKAEFFWASWLVDEEGMMSGVKHFIRQGWANGVNGAIICEPVDNHLCITQKGALRAELTTTGKMSHGAMPLAGLNPIPPMLSILEKIRQLEEEEIERLGKDAFLGYPSITPTVLQAPVKGEPQLNVVPPHCRALLDIRTVPGQSPSPKEAVGRHCQRRREVDQRLVSIAVPSKRYGRPLKRDSPKGYRFKRNWMSSKTGPGRRRLAKNASCRPSRKQFERSPEKSPLMVVSPVRPMAPFSLPGQVFRSSPSARANGRSRTKRTNGRFSHLAQTRLRLECSLAARIDPTMTDQPNFATGSGAENYDQPAAPSPLPNEQARLRLPILLFIATCLSTWFSVGPMYSLAVMTILLAHELGHYLQARRYGVPASLPYFIPMPLSPIGTMGAVIVMHLAEEIAARCLILL